MSISVLHVQIGATPPLLAPEVANEIKKFAIDHRFADILDDRWILIAGTWIDALARGWRVERFVIECRHDPASPFLLDPTRIELYAAETARASAPSPFVMTLAAVPKP